MNEREGNENGAERATIGAEVDAAGSLARVTRFFDGTPEQTVTELLQNARRAGATRIAADMLQADGDADIPPGEARFRITDDGAGIADPQVLLSFGRSVWTDGPGAREDAAGMGFF